MTGVRGDALYIVASDLEMGPGGTTDDWPQSGWIRDWLAERPVAPRTHLVFAGDTFDFLKCPVEEGWPRHIDEDVALRKWARIEAAHTGFLDALADWLRDPGHQVSFLVGNHDLELHFPAIRQALADRLGTERVTFPGNVLQHGELLIRHGHVEDPMFWIDGEPLIEHDGRLLLNLPWGAVALLDVVMPFLPELAGLDRLRPRDRVFELLPEARKLALDVFWRYWTRDFWWDLYEGDPVKRVSAAMLREVVYRMGTGDPGHQRRGLAIPLTDPPARVVCTGHWHRPGWSSDAGHRFLDLGAFRNEYVLHPDGTIGRALGQVHAEVWMRGETVVSSALVESPAPPTPAGYMPAHIEAFRGAIQRSIELPRTVPHVG